MAETLAVRGGAAVRTAPWPAPGARFGEEELANLKEALAQNTLFYTLGKMTGRLTDKMKAMTGAPFAVACSSGSAAIHGALKAAGVGPGDEVVTTPITDAGSILGIVYEGARPVFADVDPATWALTPASVEAALSPRTRAVVAVHLMGNPLDAAALAELCRRRGVQLIEDCAQAWGAKTDGRWVGTFGDFGCFSLNDFKHIGAGDGGLILTKTEEDWRRAWLCIDKCYDRVTGERAMTFCAPNYRITELQSAVALAQLDRVDAIASARNRLGARLADGLAREKLPFSAPRVAPGGYPTWWFMLLGIDRTRLPDAPANELALAVAAEGVPMTAGYVEPLHTGYPFLRDRTAFHHSDWPLEGTSYGPGQCPEAERVAGDCLKFMLNQWLTDREVDDTVAALAKVARAYGAA